MGELGSMSGFSNQTGEFCQTNTFVQESQHNQIQPYPSCSNQDQYDYSPHPMTMNSSAWVQYPYDNQLIPHLQIVEEPTHKIRFRYQSERGSHGSMSGRASNNAQKSWPTVKLVNYNGDISGVKIRASLYTEDKMKPHVHKLLGKNCNTETGDCLLPLNNDMTCCFPSLGVLFTEKKRVADVLKDRKIQSLGSVSITEEDRLQLVEEAKQEAKDMKLNSIRICFEAFNSNSEHITEPVYSEAVHNLKSPDSGELKITRLSRVTSRSEGGDEVFLLCEKVNKKDIKVRFYHQENGDFWEDFGKFTDADVHHQVAIVFKTPPYKEPNIDKPVKVFIQLYRKNDGEMSESVEFTYKPRDKDPEMIQSKKRRISDPENDYKDFGGLDQSFIGHQPYGPPGPGHGSWSDNSSQGGYPMMPQHGGHNYQGNQMANFVDAFAQELRMQSSSPSSSQDSYYSASQSSVGTPTPESSLSAQNETVQPVPSAPEAPPQELPAVGSSSAQPPVLDRPSGSETTRDVMDTSIPPTRFITGFMDPLFDLDSIQPARSPIFEVVGQMADTEVRPVSELFDMMKISCPEQSDAKSSKKISSRPKKEVKNSSANSEKKALDKSKSRPKSKSFTLGTESADIKTNSKTDVKAKTEVLDATKPERRRRSEDISRSSGRRGSETRPRLDARTRVIVEHFIRSQLIPRFGRSLRQFTTTGKVQSLLWPMAPFVACQNDDGDNSVHLAVIHQPGNNWLFQNLMPIVSSLIPSNVINHTNNLYQTPLHLAVEVEEVNVIKWLLLCGADPNVQDRRGNTPIHLAVMKKNCLTILLEKANYRIRCPTQPLPNCNIINYEGYSALHMCVLLGAMSCLNLLLDAGAQVNVQVGTNGRTPLHLAVEMQSPLLEELLKQPSLNVDAQDYAGNTPLHLACSMELVEIVHVLIKADANPLVENFICNVEDVDEVEDEQPEGHVGQTPINLSAGNFRLQSVLNGTLSVEENSQLQQARRKSRDDNAASPESQTPNGERSSRSPLPDLPSTSSAGDRHRTTPEGHFSDSSSSHTDLKTAVSTQSDVGYETGPCTTSSDAISSQEEPGEEKWMSGLCQILDPPSKDWEKLAYIVYENKSMLESIRLLETSPTKTLVNRIKEKGELLEFVLDAAGLPEACKFLQEFHNRTLNI